MTWRGQQTQQTPPEAAKRSFTGVVDKILFESPNSSWAIVLVIPDSSYVSALNVDRPAAPPSRFREDARFIKCVGVIASTVPGTYLKISGDWEINKKYNSLQFSIVSSSLVDGVISPNITKESFIKLFTSFRGVGPVTASDIYREFAADLPSLASDITEADCARIRPHCLNEVTVQGIKDGWAALSQKASILGFLYNLDFGTAVADRILTTYTGLGWNHERIKQEIKKNPYRLIDDIYGVGFEKADKAALSEEIGIATDSNFRRVAAMQFVLERAASDGHTYLSEMELYGAVQKLIGQNPVKMYDEALDKEGEGGGITHRQQAVEIRVTIPTLDDETECPKKFRIVRIKDKKIPAYALTSLSLAEATIANRIRNILTYRGSAGGAAERMAKLNNARKENEAHPSAEIEVDTRADGDTEGGSYEEA